MADLLREIWPGILIGDKDEFFDNDFFLSHGRNMNAFVDENDRINFAYKGGRPGITKNFRSDGTTTLPVFQRTDVPEYVDMDNYSTDQIHLPKVDLYALPYDKWGSLLEDARLALVDAIAKEGIWKVGPQEDSANTPVVETPSGNSAALDGFESITRQDIIKLRIELDEKYPGLKNAKWWLLVDTYAYWWLVDNDDVLKAQYGQNAPIGVLMSKLTNTPAAKGREPIPLEIGNFMLYADSRTPWYKSSDSTKYAYGATVNQATEFKSAIAYVENETFVTGMGATQIFDQLRDPATQADIASFLTRAYVGPWGVDNANLKHAGAILRKPNA